MFSHSTTVMHCLGITLNDTSSWHLVLKGAPWGSLDSSVYYMPILNCVQVIVEVRVEPQPPTSQEVPWWAIAVPIAVAIILIIAVFIVLYLVSTLVHTSLCTHTHMLACTHTHMLACTHTHTYVSSSTVSVPSLVFSNASIVGTISKL